MQGALLKGFLKFFLMALLASFIFSGVMNIIEPYKEGAERWENPDKANLWEHCKMSVVSIYNGLSLWTKSIEAWVSPEGGMPDPDFSIEIAEKLIEWWESIFGDEGGGIDIPSIWV